MLKRARNSLGIHLLIFLTAYCISCQPTNQEHREMVERLERWATELENPENPFANHTRITHFQKLLERPDPDNKQTIIYQLAKEYLRSGYAEKAIPLYLQLDSTFEAGPYFPDKNLIHRQLGLAYFRLGEQENCQHHGHSSCIFPINISQTHQLPQGSEKSIEVYEEILKNHEHKSDTYQQNLYDIQWLLNLAYMTLGQYPAQVPSSWLIPPDKWTSGDEILPFTETAMKYKVSVDGMSGGVILDDFNGDGWLDLVTSGWGLSEQLRYFENQGIQGDHFLGFEEKTVEAGLSGITGGLNLLQTDYNNDGWLDILVLRGAWLIGDKGQPNSLLKNQGDGTFTDVTASTGLLSFHPTQTAVWQDFNRDGWLDVFIGNESRGTMDVHPCELYLNNQDGTFREIARMAGVRVNRYVKGVTSGDYDQDGWPDLYVSTLKGKNYLFKNQGKSSDGEITFQDVSESAGLGNPIPSFPTWFWDFDQDGWLDIFVAEFVFELSGNSSLVGEVARGYLSDTLQAGNLHLFRNQGDGTFLEVTDSLGLTTITYAMGCNYGDLDQDGWPDFYLGTGEPNLSGVMPNEAWRNNKGAYFQRVTASSQLGHLQKGHAIAFGDIDRDGDQDIYAVMGGAFEGDHFANALFENPYHHPGVENSDAPNWISLELTGIHSNQAAIGAQIEILVAQSDTLQTFYRHVSSGASFGANSLVVEMGLGNAERIHKLTITWPDSTLMIQSFDHIPLNKHYILVEGDTLAENPGISSHHFATRSNVPDR